MLPLNARANPRERRSTATAGIVQARYALADGRQTKPGVAVSIEEDMDSDDNAGIGPYRDTPGETAEQAAERRSAEDEDLRESIAGLSRLASDRLTLEALLTRVATYAVQAIPGADGAGLTLLERDRADTIVATAPFVSEVDAIQYGVDQGPCISAAREGQTILSGSLGGDSRWPRFGGRVARLGVHSVVSLPLITPDGVVGAMNVYAHDKNAFDERAAELGQIFAAPAAIAVHNAHVLAQTQRLANQLQSALELRGVIDRAVGILMSRSGSTEHEALERLRTLSQHEHRKLSEVARQIVDEAVARARALRSRQSHEPS
jgi:GAF domain-containing protein